jgi:predicted ester cyclase
MQDNGAIVRDFVEETINQGRIDSTDQIVGGDKVLSRFEWTGTHRGEFLGVPATGRPVKVWGMVVDRLVDGRIKETRIIMDTLGLMMQLGAIPPPPSA